MTARETVRGGTKGLTNEYTRLTSSRVAKKKIKDQRSTPGFCERPAFGTRPPRHAPQCLPAFLFVTMLLRQDSLVASMASRGERGESDTCGRREPAVCMKGIIMQRNPSYLDRRQAYTQGQVLIALLAPG